MYNTHTKESLLKATQDLLWERGYESTSPRDIQRQAKAGQGSFYHHFEGKLDLAGQALDRTADEMIDGVVQAIERSSDDPRDRLLAYLHAPRDALRGCRLGRHALESSINETKIREPVERYFARIRDGLARTVTELAEADRLVGDVDPESIADALIATVQGAYVLARVHQDAARLGSALDGAAALLRTLVKPS